MNGRGGKREGAGRHKSLKGDLIRYSIYLEEDTVRLLNSAISQYYGEENIHYKKAEFIRNAVLEYANKILKKEDNK